MAESDPIPTVKDLHPSPTAGGSFAFKDLPERHGIRSEANYIRCQQCGYPIDRSRTTPGSGYGNITSAEVTGETVGGVVTCREPAVNGGCPFCGTSNYEPSLLDQARQEGR